MKTLEIDNEINNTLTEGNKQTKFIESTIGKTINAGLNLGLRYLLPDFLEDQIIEIKDEFIKNGFNDGCKKAVDSALTLGKSAIGIVTGNFENISQVQAAVRTGGIIDSLSNLINNIVNKVVNKGKVPYSVGNIIKQGKNVILSNISKSIEKEFESQLDSIEKLAKYSENWKDYYSNRDFEGMEREYKKIEEKIKNIIPIENTIKEVRTIENLHKLIKSNGQKFELSDEQIELANML